MNENFGRQNLRAHLYFVKKKKCKRSLQKSSEAMSCNISNCNYNPNYNKIIVKRICSNQITAISNRNEGQGRKVTFQDCLSLTFLRRSHILGVVFGYKKKDCSTRGVLSFRYSLFFKSNI